MSETHDSKISPVRVIFTPAGRPIIDVSGQEFNDWTVLDYVGYNKNKVNVWRIQCRCGFIKTTHLNAVRSGDSKRCKTCASGLKGLKVMKDRSGQRYGAIVIESLDRIDHDPVTGHRRFYWRCRCDCGELTTREAKTAMVGSPGCTCYLHRGDYDSGRNRMWNQILDRAADRDIPVLASREYVFQLLVEQGFRCALTGLPIGVAATAKEHVRGGTTASLDRRDSGRPYEPGNLQWVHKVVNKMKLNHSQDYFIEICRLVAAHNAPRLHVPGADNDAKSSAAG